MAAAATAEFYAAVVWRPAQAHILYSFAAQKICVQRSRVLTNVREGKWEKRRKEAVKDRQHFDTHKRI